MTGKFDFSDLSPTDMPSWAAALGDMLLDARQALRDKDHAAMDIVSDELTEFTRFNAFESLDRIAFETISDLATMGIDDALSSIGARTIRLKALTGDINKVSQDAVKSAASIKMETVTTVLGATEDAIKSLRKFKDAAKSDANLKDVVASLDDFRKKATQLRDELKKAGDGG
jgi:hypothetical protein